MPGCVLIVYNLYLICVLVVIAMSSTWCFLIDADSADNLPLKIDPSMLIPDDVVDVQSF